MIENGVWGEARAQDSARHRRTRTIVAVIALIAVPILIPFFTGLYMGFTDAHRGIDRNGEGMPQWVAVTAVAGFAIVAAGMCALLYRSRDEFERCLLANAAAVFGVAMLILSPAFGLIGYYADRGELQMAAWMASLMAGLGTYVVQRVRG